MSKFKLISDATELPPHFFMNIYEAHKTLCVPPSGEGPQQKRERHTLSLVRSHLVDLSAETDGTLYALERYARVYLQREYGETAGPLVDFIYRMGGVLNGDCLDEPFYQQQLAIGASITEHYGKMDFFRKPILTDKMPPSELVDRYLPILTGINYSLLGMDTKDFATQRGFAKDHVFFHLDARYEKLYFLATLSRQDLVYQGHDEKTIDAIEEGLYIAGFELGLKEKARHMARMHQQADESYTYSDEVRIASFAAPSAPRPK